MPIEILVSIILVTLKDKKAGLGVLSHILKEGEYGKAQGVANKAADALDKIIPKL